MIKFIEKIFRQGRKKFLENFWFYLSEFLRQTLGKFGVLFICLSLTLAFTLNHITMMQKKLTKELSKFLILIFHYNHFQTSSYDRVIDREVFYKIRCSVMVLRLMIIIKKYLSVAKYMKVMKWEGPHPCTFLVIQHLRKTIHHHGLVRGL